MAVRIAAPGARSRPGLRELAVIATGAGSDDGADVVAPIGFVALRVAKPVPVALGGGHGRGCMCCVPLSGLAAALIAAVHQRARGEIAVFDAVCMIAGPAQAASVAGLIESDRVLAGYFRLSVDPGPPQVVGRSEEDTTVSLC